MSEVALNEADIRNRMKSATARMELLARKKAQVSDLSKEINLLEDQLKRDCAELNDVMATTQVPAIVVGDWMAEAGNFNPRHFFKKVRVIPYDEP